MKKILLFSLIISLLFACGKYEDGPMISLRTKEKRLVGEWKLVESSNEILTTIADFYIDIKKDGDAELIPYINTNGLGVSSGLKLDGEWEWTNKKEGIRLSLDTDMLKTLLSALVLSNGLDPEYINLINNEYEFEITRLTNKELWLKYDGDEYWKLEKE